MKIEKKNPYQFFFSAFETYRTVKFDFRLEETNGPFTPQIIFWHGSHKNGTRTKKKEKKRFGTGKFCSVNDFAVPNFIPAEPKFHPCSALLKR